MTTFHCEDPDFVLKSIPDGVSFPVRRSSMMSSEVFRDMFSCCDVGSALSSDNQFLELDESIGPLTALLKLLHAPPPPPASYPREKYERKVYNPETVIPYPLLPLLFRLADKYILPDSTIESLREHLLGNALLHPLQVYGFASLHNMDTVAAKASRYLRPMASYKSSEIKVVPSVAAYHKVVCLQDLRVKKIRSLLLGEDVFPHGYGACPSHGQSTPLLWDNVRQSILGKIETDSDVAYEMSVVLSNVRGCRTCEKACTAAIEMLAYKYRKIPSKIDQISEI